VDNPTLHTFVACRGARCPLIVCTMPTEENRTSVNVTRGVHAKLLRLASASGASSNSKAIEYLLANWDRTDPDTRAASIGHANLNPIPEKPARLRRRTVAQ
jgi:hypothetical protein